ncbi:MAG TPA: ferritin-like domain-containing protein [Ignavibacteria bacterium]|nr:ferritin-like domain-containing protein [Ignavibacteria bacterium]HMQ99134.1 ferritin-like domain-containing protein [Ignavibacteria bacterium]
MAKLKTLEDFLMEELKDLYSAEKQLTKALPKMAKAAASDELRQAFEDHLSETESQVVRLEKISKLAGKSLAGKKCRAMEGLIEEGKEILEEDCTPEVRDVALIAAAQKVEHYEIASYGCAKTYARLLGYNDIEELLENTEMEESAADEKLTAISEELNAEALEPAEAEE